MMMNHKLMTLKRTSESIYSNLFPFIDEESVAQRRELTYRIAHSGK